MSEIQDLKNKNRSRQVIISDLTNTTYKWQCAVSPIVDTWGWLGIELATCHPVKYGSGGTGGFNKDKDQGEIVEVSRPGVGNWWQLEELDTI